MAEHFVAIATYAAKTEPADHVAQLLPTLAVESRQELGNISYAIARPQAAERLHDCRSLRRGEHGCSASQKRAPVSLVTL